MITEIHCIYPKRLDMIKTTPFQAFFKSTFLLTMVVVTLNFSSRAQLVTSTAMTPQQLVNNVLVGTGVNVSNITYTGSANAIGEFDGSNCNVGIASGILLTTGTVLNTNTMGIPEGPHGPNNEPGAGIDNNEPGDPLLTALGGAPSFNAARLEFDFVPTSDSIKFNFVFASEEYLEFVNAGVNDAFGFFVSGPNPAGGNYANQNIALVPGTTTPVTIDNVNSTVNSAYYIDNGDGSTAPFNASNTYIQYDGLTTVMTAEAHVICGQTYHIVILISDIGDGVLDSGVFLEAGSFSSNASVQISSELSFQGSVANDSTLYEGCTDATLWFVRNDSLNYTQTYTIDVLGSATSGVDYSGVPGSITFLPGEDSTSITLSTILDYLTEGTETVQIGITVPSNCGTPNRDSVILYIEDVDSLDVNVNASQAFCPGDTLTLNASVTGGRIGYSYLWHNGTTGSTTTVWPTSDTTFYVTVTDTCGSSKTDTIHITTTPPPPLALVVDGDTTLSCKNVLLDLLATATDGYGGYVYNWSNGGSSNQISIQAIVTTTYTVTVTDACGFTVTDSAVITINEPPLFSSITADTTICLGDSVKLVATGIGGVGSDYGYTWSTGQTDSVIYVSPNTTTEYHVAISDLCGYDKAWDTVTVNVIETQASFHPNGSFFEENIPIQFINTSTAADAYFWDLDIETSTLENPEAVYPEGGFYNILLVATNTQYGCVDSATLQIKVQPEFFFYVPNAFTPNGDGLNDQFSVEFTGDLQQYEMLIFNRWGEAFFQTNDPNGFWDGTYNGSPSPIGVYVYKINLTNHRGEYKEYIGHVTIVR